MIRITTTVFCVLCVLACSSSAPDRVPDRDPVEPLRLVLDALEHRDCAGLEAHSGGALGTKLDEAGCEQSFDAFEKVPYRLVSVLDVSSDGRTPNARIIRVRLDVAGAEQDVTVRVEPERDHWVLVTL
jgi:hypothetical protein